MGVDLFYYNNTSGSHIFGTVASETDSLGNVTRYFYDTNNGRLLAAVYPNGDGVVEGTEYSDNILGVQGHPEADDLLPELFAFLAWSRCKNVEARLFYIANTNTIDIHAS